MCHRKRKSVLLFTFVFGSVIILGSTVYAASSWRSTRQPAFKGNQLVSSTASFTSATVEVHSNDHAITESEATGDSPTHLGSATHFTATVTSGTNITYTWNFGDGGSDTGQTVSHTYATTGIYTTTVTARNNNNSQMAFLAV